MTKVGFNRNFEDAAVLPVPNSDLVLVKNLDILTPIVDEPNLTGQIAACNVTNDVFAMNVPEISGMLVFLALQLSTPKYVSEGILEGIKYFMEKKIHSKVVGGHTIYCEWPLIGGEASGFVSKSDIIWKGGVKLGDKLILTKPLGLQAISAVYRILKSTPEMLENYSPSELKTSINLAIEIMTTSNQNVVKTIHSFKDFSFVHAMSDVTGFGLAGHLQEMLQNSELSAIIEKVPSIKFSQEISNELGYALNDCRSAETAGGMLIAVDNEKVNELSDALTNNGVKNWIVGFIDNVRPNFVRVSEQVEHIEVSKL